MSVSKQAMTNLYVLRPHGAHARNTQHKTYCIQNVRLPAPIETGNRIETLIPATDDRPDGIGLKAVNHDLNDPHSGDACCRLRYTRNWTESARWFVNIYIRGIALGDGANLSPIARPFDASMPFYHPYHLRYLLSSNRIAGTIQYDFYIYFIPISYAIGPQATVKWPPSQSKYFPPLLEAERLAFLQNYRWCSIQQSHRFSCQL